MLMSLRYRQCFVMLVESVAVLDRVNGNHLVPPAVDVFQPEQQPVAHLVEILQVTDEAEALEPRGDFSASSFTPTYLTLHEGFL